RRTPSSRRCCVWRSTRSSCDGDPELLRPLRRTDLLVEPVLLEQWDEFVLHDGQKPVLDGLPCRGLGEVAVADDEPLSEGGVLGDDLVQLKERPDEGIQRGALEGALTPDEALRLETRSHLEESETPPQG